MRLVVFACLGILLMTVDLGSGENIHVVVGEGQQFSKTCPPNTLFGAINAIYGHSFACEGDVINPIQEKCFGKSSCQFPVTNAFFGWDPCKFWPKHLDLEYKCWPKAFLAGAQPAHGSQWMLLQCPPEEKIEIVYVAYAKNSLSRLKREVTDMCGGKRTCHFSPWNIPNTKCEGCVATVYYRCAVSLNDQNERCWPEDAEWVKFISSHVEEHSEITLNCPHNTKFGVMAALYRSSTYCGKFVDTQVDNLCFGKTLCKFRVTNEALAGDACPFQHKFLDMTYGCWPKAANLGRLQMVHGEEHQEVTLNCPPNKNIEIVSARFGLNLCFKYVTEPVDKQCTGKQTCKFPLTVQFLGETCFLRRKAADVWYRCWPKEYWRCSN